jgi:hypothetical protein
MEHVRNIEQKKVLWHHAEMIHNAGQRLAEERDRKDLEELFSQIGFGTDVE